MDGSPSFFPRTFPTKLGTCSLGSFSVAHPTLHLNEPLSIIKGIGLP